MVTRVKFRAFWRRSSLTKVVVSDGVGLGKSVFDESGIREVVLPSDMENIPDSLFVFCEKLEEITIPAGVTNIGANAFQDCVSLWQVHLPEALISIQPLGFYRCKSLKEIRIPENTKRLHDYAFGYCTNLKSANVPNGVASLGWGLFWYCGNLEEIDLPDSVVTIGREAFYNCAKLKNITLPENVRTIGTRAFRGCASLEAVNFLGKPMRVSYVEADSFPTPSIRGTYTPKYRSEWKAAINDKGYWYGLKMEENKTDFTIIYNPNGGTGSIDNQVGKFGGTGVTVNNGRSLGWKEHFFVGWALAPDGAVVYREGDTVVEPAEGDTITLYAVWTKTLTVRFYNNANKMLSPSSLAAHLSWCVQGGSHVLNNGASVEVAPGTLTIIIHVDDEYKWIVGRFDLGDYASLYDENLRTLTVNIRNDNADPFYGPPTDRSEVIYVGVNPLYDDGWVQFSCQPEIKDSLKGRIKQEEVPFKETKVHIAIRRATIDDSGKLVVDQTAAPLTDVRPNELYSFPRGFYYITSVTYDADQKSGDPYWDYVVKDKYAAQTFEVGENLLDFCLNFDLFGEYDAVKVDLDPRKGECERSSVWFVKNFLSGALIDGKMLPRPKKDAYEFEGWFMADGKTKIEEDAEFNPLLEDDCTLYAHWKTKVTEEWLLLFPELAARAKGDVETAASMTAANGCRTVGECYELGINPEDPNDDFKISSFAMKDGKPVISLNHTKDGAGNSFASRVKTLGKASLSDEGWREVPEDGDAALRFFKVTVESP